MTETEQIEALASHYRAILELLGEDPNRPGLQKTPIRAAKALIHATSGYKRNLQQVVNEALFPSSGTGMVTVKDIEFYSLCEHHVLPFFGHVSVAYIPQGAILGISKLARVVDMYARRLQVQEVLTKQVAEAIAQAAGTPDVMVTIRAQHLCMKMRGVEKQDSETLTIEKFGRFANDPALVSEFFAAH